MSWISVEDRLPGNTDEVLVRYSYIHPGDEYPTVGYDVAEFSDGTWECNDPDTLFDLIDYWMEIPQLK